MGWERTMRTTDFLIIHLLFTELEKDMKFVFQIFLMIELNI
jgi:hypothetical protein